MLSQSSNSFARKTSIAQPKMLKTPSTTASKAEKEEAKPAAKESNTRPTTARPNEKKEEESKTPARGTAKQPAASGSQPAFKPLEIGDFDDPIAHAFHARVKLGGSQEAVIKDTDARKVGVQLVKTFKLATSKGPDLIELLT